MEDTSKKTDERVNDIFFGPLERPALKWLCEKMPAWMNPDILTAIGVLGGLLIAVSYWLSSYNTNFLWLVDLGLVINWFGDSLDGNLARHRKMERIKYGFFVDHAIDTFIQTVIFVGLGLSPFIGFNFAMLALVGYMQMAIFIYIVTAVTGVFKISYGKIGPTEMRVLLIAVNAVFYFASNPTLDFSFATISLYNLITFAAAIGLQAYYIFFAIKQALILNKQDRPKSI